MIAVDASAILAILFNEPEAKEFEAALVDSGGAAISPINFWEVLVRAEVEFGVDGRYRVEWLVEALKIDVVPAGEKSARLAADAFSRFGKRSAAGLNLGDCFAYALASELGEGLLYKGDDFPKTDIPAAMSTGFS